jgi:hypothetical protein
LTPGNFRKRKLEQFVTHKLFDIQGIAIKENVAVIDNDSAAELLNILHVMTCKNRRDLVLHATKPFNNQEDVENRE